MAVTTFHDFPLASRDREWDGAAADKRLSRRLPPGPADLRRTAGIENATRGLLLGGVMPLWIGAGLADWYLHRRTRIEDTAGPRESALHSLMSAETGVPVLLGLFCEVNAGVLATAAGAVAAHSATAYWDQAYAEPRRRVTPVEQHVHSLLEVSPIMATFLLTALHWDQAKALAGQDRQPPRFGLRLKRRDPLSTTARVGLLAAVTAFGVLPYAEELLRCWRANPRLSPLPEPAEPATETLRAPGQDQDSRPGTAGRR
jgi:hypothetical protein